MKKKLLIFFVFLFFILLLLDPKEALEGSNEGLLLWFHTVLPTLLPFIILTNLILRLDAVHSVCRFVSPVLGRLFGLDTYGCYALITGFLCGYPMGAKITADLLKENRLSKEDAQFLLGISNNASPMFFLGYVITQSLDCPQYKAHLLLILYGTPLFYACCTNIFRQIAQKINRKKRLQACSLPSSASLSISTSTNKRKAFSFQIIDDSIMDGFETITRLGGYIILFAIIAKMATVHLSTVTIFHQFLIGCIEITNGVHTIGSSTPFLAHKIPLVITIVTFGGLSGIAQTKSMIQGTSLSLTQYVITKLKLSCAAFLLSVLYCRLFVI